jgi:hypothetical protein
MESDKMAENTPNALKFIFPKFVCPSPIVWGFDEKKLLWESVFSGVHKVEPQYLSFDPLPNS